MSVNEPYLRILVFKLDEINAFDEELTGLTNQIMCTFYCKICEKYLKELSLFLGHLFWHALYVLLPVLTIKPGQRMSSVINKSRLIE